MTERWLPVIGYEGLYEISDHGRVKSPARKRVDGRFYKERIIAQSLQNGYPYVSLYHGKKGRRVSVHSLVARAFLGASPYNYEVNHKDGVKTNPNVSNLEWCTKSENQKHAIRMGLRPRRTKVAFQKGFKPWNKGKITGQIPWNKGR